MTTKIITTAIIKGGTGKTTTAAALAQAAAKDGRRVLAIDLDPQGSLSFILGADPTKKGSYSLLQGEDPAGLLQATGQGLTVLSASSDLATVSTSQGSAKRLQGALEGLKRRYDFIFIDTPPQIGELTLNALQASTGLLIPLEADRSSLQGLYQILGIAAQMRAANPSLKALGTVLTRYDPRPKLNRYLRDTIASKGKDLGAPLLAEIRPGIAVKEAQALQQSLFDYAPTSKPAADYMDLYHAIRKGRT